MVEEQSSSSKLVPIVAYPEKNFIRKHGNTLALQKLNQGLSQSLEQNLDRELNRKLLAGEYSSSEIYSLQDEMNTKSGQSAFTGSPEGSTGKKNVESSIPSDSDLFDEEQIVLPLIHESMMMGLLVTVREDRAWELQERREIERIAQTLAIASVIDRRRGWLEEQLHQQQILQEKQQDLLDTLLHQLRNPITALRTFGKLLIKRFKSTDANAEVANSIVRESDRLKELVQKFDEVLNLSLNLETRPARSTRVCEPPVQAGCVVGSISSVSVSPSLP